MKRRRAVKTRMLGGHVARLEHDRKLARENSDAASHERDGRYLYELEEPVEELVNVGPIRQIVVRFTRPARRS